MIATRSRKASQKTRKTTEPKAPALYAGAPIPATKVLTKQMQGFSAKQGNKCDAVAWMILNENEGTVTYCNSYNGLLKASYQPKHYTYPIKEKVITKKLEEYQEIDATDWPSFVEHAAGRKRGRRVVAK